MARSRKRGQRPRAIGPACPDDFRKEYPAATIRPAATPTIVRPTRADGAGIIGPYARRPSPPRIDDSVASPPAISTLGRCLAAFGWNIKPISIDERKEPRPRPMRGREGVLSIRDHL